MIHKIRHLTHIDFWCIITITLNPHTNCNIHWIQFYRRKQEATVWERNITYPKNRIRRNPISHHPLAFRLQQREILSFLILTGLTVHEHNIRLLSFLVGQLTLQQHRKGNRLAFTQTRHCSRRWTSISPTRHTDTQCFNPPYGCKKIVK